MIDWNKPIETVPCERWSVATWCEVICTYDEAGKNEARIAVPVEHGDERNGYFESGEDWLYQSDGTAWTDQGEGNWPRVRNVEGARSQRGGRVMSKPENPPAYPRDHRHSGHNGMTLRDHFATHALAALISRNDAAATMRIAVQKSYMYADLMLEERNKK